MKSRFLPLFISVMLLGVSIVSSPGITSAQNAGGGQYQVTIENLTNGQPFSPPVAATHRDGMHLFQLGEPASLELEAIAEDGNPMPMVELLTTSDQVSQAVNVGRPLTPQGTETVVEGMTVTDSATFEISAMPGDLFSLTTMLICTNDGFLGLDGVALPESGSTEYIVSSYDAGTETNTEQSQDIVDPCSALGPVMLAGDPDGNVGMGPEDAPISSMPAEMIAAHDGIQGSGELLVDGHGWNDPVALVTITRLPAN